MQSKATTVAEYLASLPADRRAAITAVRKVILDNLGKGFEEGMQYGMIGYYVPHSLFPAGYHCDPKQPLPYAALASQKNYMSLYLMSVYTVEGDVKGAENALWFQKEWKKTGKKLDMGKCCVRFKKLDDVALDVVAEAFRRVSVQDHVNFYLDQMDWYRKQPKGKPAAKAAVKKKTAAKPAAKKARTASGKVKTKR